MQKVIGILTSGGDAPGMNAAIRAVVRSAISRGFKVYGIEDGYQGLVEGKFIELERSSVSDIMFRGGTFLGSARCLEFKQSEVQDKAIENMKKVGMDYLVVIGGDGTYRGAGALCDKGVKVVGIPGTIDNDCPGTQVTIGFQTALSTIIDAVDKLRDTSASHHRCSVVEVMGNHCGDLALYAAICCGAEIAITPEDGYDEQKVIDRLNYFDKTKKKRHSIVIVSEKLINTAELAKTISEKTPFAGRATVLGHIQRGGSPVPYDRMLATRIGDYAVQILDEGKSRCCVGVVDEKVIYTPFDKALKEGKIKGADLREMFERLA